MRYTLYHYDCKLCLVWLLIYRLWFYCTTNLSKPTAYRIVDISLDHLFACSFKSILIGIELTSIPACIMLRFGIKHGSWPHWASLEVNKNVAVSSLPNKIHATNDCLTIAFQAERTLMISLYGSAMSCSQIFSEVSPSKGNCILNFISIKL